MNKRVTVAISGTVVAALVIAIPLYRSCVDASFRSDFLAVKDNQPPLTTNQVEKIMGHPVRIEHSETTGITGDVYHYPYKDRDMKIVFVNGVVFNAEVVPGVKS